MATEQTLTTLIINKVDSKETFNKMKAQGLVNENELYLTPEDAMTDDHINSLIDAKLGVIENGSY